MDRNIVCLQVQRDNITTVLCIQFDYTSSSLLKGEFITTKNF